MPDWEKNLNIFPFTAIVNQKLKGVPDDTLKLILIIVAAITLYIAFCTPPVIKAVWIAYLAAP